MLPVISEDGNDFMIAPTPMGAGVNGMNKMPMRTTATANSMTTKPWAKVQNSDSPRSYMSMSDASGSDTDHEMEKRLNELRENPQIAKRGGWRRLALVAGIMVLCIAGLVAGLVVGLKRNNS
jgi:hypothetical protein